MGMRRSLIRDEKGLTTVGMVVALLVSLALIFSSAQLYRIESSSAAVQEVADAAALAAENEVAEFMVAVRVCDAAVLSMSLLSVCLYGAGVVALCVPAGASVAAKLIEYAGKVAQTRDAFAEKASKGLDALQRALPFMAAANAASVASANNGGVMNAQYCAAAMLVPASGVDIAIAQDEGVDELGQDVEGSADAISEAALEAERAAERAQEFKKAAFERDCGAAPGYCMYERAESLAGLDAALNPLYQSVDSWSFSVALSRAQSYYAARLANEKPTFSSVEAQADSALRKRFYAYAVDLLATGYVREDEASFDAFFPRLFRNTDEMRETALYDEAAYPVTSRGGSLMMHAWGGCPEAAGFERLGTLRELDGGGFATCESCAFTVSSMGNVAAASTSIDNGFEYHYAAVAEAAEGYEKAYAEYLPQAQAVKDEAAPLLETCAELAQGMGDARISATPPGYKGAIALVANVGEAPADAGFSNLFAGSSHALGMRAAVSGATLVPDAAHDGTSVISSLLDGLKQDGGAAVGAAGIVLDCWSGLLSVYAAGQEDLTSAIEQAIGSLPLVGPSGLGTWAADRLREAIAAVGLQPVELDALKPLLVNTAHIARADEGGFSVALREAKQRALSLSGSSTSLFTALVDDVEAGAYDAIEKVEGGVVIAVIDFPVGGLEIPLTLALPPSITQRAEGFVEQCFAAVRGLEALWGGEGSWT